jgi:hypothetical protein
MTKHVITGSFVLIIGDSSSGNEWQPVNPVANQPIWTVLVVQFGKSEVGEKLWSSPNHLPDGSLEDHRIALVANWKGPAPYSINPSRDTMYRDTNLASSDAQAMVDKIFRGTGTGSVPYANTQNVLAFLGAQAPPPITELIDPATGLGANITIPAGRANLAELQGGDAITIPGVGTINIPT